MIRESPPTPEITSYTVCGLVVLTQPDSYQRILSQVGQLECVEIHQSDDSGRLAITVEEFPDSPLITHQIEKVRCLEGVLDVALAYTHSEPLNDPSESSSDHASSDKHSSFNENCKHLHS